MAKRDRSELCRCCDRTWFDWMMLGLAWLLVAMWIANRLTVGCANPL